MRHTTGGNGDIPIPGLDSMGIDQLVELQDDGAAFLAFFNALPQVRAVEAEEKKLMEENEALAKRNLEKEEPLRRAREAVIARHEELAKAQALYAKTQSAVDEIRKQFSPANIATMLEIKVREADEAAEKLAADFDRGAISIDDFVKAYTEAKQLYHLRDLKRIEFDKLTT